MHFCYTIKDSFKKLVIVILMSLPLMSWGQCPTISAILVDACGTEQLNEFVIINSGGGFNTSNLQLSFDVNNNIIGQENNDINIDMGNLPGGPCGLQTGDPSMITGCSNVIPIGPGFNVPANSMVVLQTSAGANSPYNFSSICGAGGCIYVIQSNCTRSAGGFSNAGAGMRTSILGTTTGCSNTYVYNQASLTGGNGAYFMPSGPMTYGNAGCAAPPVGPAPSGPDFNDIPNPSMCGSYTLPPITGSNLTGNESYYSAPNGGGTQYFPGDVITSTTTLYIYDTSSSCSDQESFTITITAAPAVFPAGPLTLCGNAMNQATFNLTALNNTVNGGSGAAVNWFTNMAGTIPVGTPGAFTTGTTTVYAIVGMAPCQSAPQAVQLNVTSAATPTFTQLGPYCQGESAAPLPTTSNNGINGTWSPATISTASPGTATYTFTPAVGQCATPTTMMVTVTAATTPTFTQLGPYCQNASAAALPTTSNNGITGTWSPATISTASPGTATYTFTPGVGQCGTPTTMMVTVTAATTPTFTQLGPYCQNESAAALPTTSNNGITGTWSPATISTPAPGTATYTFTPGVGQCGTPTTMMVTVTAGVTPTFTQLGPYCQNASAAALPTTSNNGITGTWSPATISTAAPGTATYTFTPGVGQCGTPTTMMVTVNAATTPTFTQLGPYCQNESAAGLPAFSNNGISGTWSPATISTAALGTTTYTFTPGAGQCATPTTMMVTIVTGIMPGFTQLGPYCQNENAGALPTFSNNGISGTWNPAIINTSATGTTTYTFTPGAGQCATPTTMMITITPAPTAIPTSLSACDNGSGQATFNLTSADLTINGNTGNAVDWFLNANGTGPINNPAAFTAGMITVYAVVTNGLCSSTPVGIPLNILAAPIANEAMLEQCATSGTQLIFNLNALNNIVNGGSGNAVTWYSNAAGTTLINNPGSYTTASTIVYARTTNGQCTSAPTQVVLIVTPVPVAVATNLQACDAGGASATFNLNNANNTINGGSGSMVSWFLSANGTNPIGNPGAFTTGSMTVYAVVTDGPCSSMPVPVVLTVNPLPSLSIAIAQAISCNSANNGGINLTVSSGTMPYTFDWNVNALDGIEDPAGLAAGTYAVTVSDMNGCQSNTSITLNQPATLSITCGQASPVSTPGGNDGSASVAIMGGTAPYTITWSGAASGTQMQAAAGTATLMNLVAGSYNVTVTDANNCTTTCSFVINDPSCNVQVSAMGSNPTCNSATDGTIDLTVTGQSPFTFDWNINALDGIEDPMAVGAGVYSVTVTDGIGCQAITSITLIAPTALSLACSEGNQVSTPGGNDGVANINIGGGTAPYNLEWTGPADGMQVENAAGAATIANLLAGTYMLTLTDANGCTETCSFTINTAGCMLDVVLNSSAISPCFGAVNGVIVLEVFNASGTVQYDWNVDALDGMEDPSGLMAGFYAVTVTDDAGCSDTLSVTLSTPPYMVESCEVLSPASGPMAADGSAQITYSNGLPPYTIIVERQGGGYNDTIVSAMAGVTMYNDLLPGYYNVSLLDANNCLQGCAFIICGGMDISLSAENESCPGAGDGSAVAVVTGGFDPYTFAWSNSQNNDTITNLGAGVYVLTVTDDLGCVATDSIELLAPVPLDLMCSQQSPVSAPGATDGEASIVVGGGTAPYILMWSGAASGSQNVTTAGTVTISNLAAGVYSLTLSDANGCTTTCGFTISAPGCDLSASAVAQNETCPGNLNGGIELTVSGGTMPFTFDWNDNSLDGIEDLMGLAPGIYNVTITDANGCMATASATVAIQNTLPNATISAGSTICEDDCFDFNLTLTGTPPFIVNYDVDAGNGVQSLVGNFANNTGIISICPSSFNLTNGSITISLTGISDANCTNALSAASTLTVRPHSSATIAPSLCPGESIVVNGTTYDESNPAGVEVITGGNAAGCDSTITINLTYFPPANGMYDETLCAGETRTIGGVTFDETNPSGTVTLPAASANGCDSTVMVNLTFLQASMTDVSMTLCPGESIVVNGNTYDEGMPTGQETLLAVNGCDSIVAIQLSFYPPSLNTITQTLCEGESLTVNGTVYDESSPSGTEIIAGGSANGCDSTITVSLQFAAPAMENIVQTICPDEQIVVNETVYNEANPSGTEVILGGSVNGCDSIIAVALSFFAAPVSDVVQTLCSGESITVGNTVYDENNPSGTEVLQTVNGCDSTISVSLTFLPNTTSQINETLCFGESMTVNGTIYNVNNPSGTEMTQAANGCDSIITVNLSFSAPITASIEGNASICNGSSATLTFRFAGETAFNVTYSNGIGAPVTLNNISDGATITVSPSATVTYTILSATAIGNACPVSISGSAVVSVSNLMVQGQVTSDYQGFGVSCPDRTDGSATALPLGGLPPYTYLWSDGQTGAVAQNLAAAIYTVTLTDAAGCTGTASVGLTASPGVVALATGVSPSCYGDRNGRILIETLNGGSAPYAYSLDGSAFQPLPSALPFTIANLEAGIYDLSIRDANGCIGEVETTIDAPQELLLELGDDRTIKLGDSTLISAQVNFDIAQLQWNPVTNLGTPDAAATYASPQETTAYRLTASDANGCSISDVVTIFVNKKRSVYIPNVFTPNGDGFNDQITVFAGKDVLEIKGFSIFDRWGNLLYQKGPFQPNDLQYGWDGNFEGQPMNAGVYVFYAEVVFLDGFTELFKGDVTLMR